MKAIERFKSLKDNRNVSLEARATYVSLKVDLYLLIISGFYTVFFLLQHIWPLAIVSGLTFATYFYLLWQFEKNYDIWVYACFISVFIFTVVMTIFVGWDAGFQLFIFGEVAAFFLPSIKEKGKRTRSFSIAIVFMVTYIVLFLVHTYLPDFSYSISESSYTKMYILNVIATFLTIISFTYVYSTQSEYRLTELSRRADFDELTRLYNRYTINQILKVYIKEYQEKHKPFSVAIIDIDFFKNVNDTYGHNSGDDVLKGISKILKRYSRSGITVGRWGGEEFILIAPPSIDTQRFIKELDKIRKYIESGEFVSNGQRIGVTISVGVERYRNGWGPKEIVDAADRNLYRAKETGRNKVVY